MAEQSKQLQGAVREDFRLRGLHVEDGQQPVLAEELCVEQTGLLEPELRVGLVLQQRTRTPQPWWWWQLLLLVAAVSLALELLAVH